ncbi:ABC transporter permease [Halococcus saccharolyticus]|uniref:ABC-2 type transporter n=1 Tax=Halococcus saccharolyticus DSM 5350 TaxID=1227455 RepID=M0MKS4_9EURY|nr:ABC transporter permease [Halococcus saccharolyticus]EMA46271.1 ABC-2 type transporter [Halococcus saccharolyticus DSM 5350]
MSTLAVARKDFSDAVRSRSLIALVALFVLFAGGATYLVAEVLGGSGGGTEGLPPVFGLFIALITPITVLVPLIGVMTGYKSIVGERESGSVKLLLSLPHTRRDVVAGKTIGRTAVFAVAIIVGFAVAAAVAFVSYGSFPAVEYAGFTLMTIVFGLVYLVFAVGMSAATGSTSIALWISLGLFALFQFLWGFVVNLLVWVVNGFSSPANFSLLTGYVTFGENAVVPPDWYRLVVSLNPSSAYQSTLGTIFSQDLNFGVSQSQSLPYYLQDWFGFVVLAIWLVVPLVLGYLRFNRSDL